MGLTASATSRISPPAAGKLARATVRHHFVERTPARVHAHAQPPPTPQSLIPPLSKHPPGRSQRRAALVLPPRCSSSLPTSCLPAFRARPYDASSPPRTFAATPDLVRALSPPPPPPPAQQLITLEAPVAVVVAPVVSAGMHALALATVGSYAIAHHATVAASTRTNCKHTPARLAPSGLACVCVPRWPPHARSDSCACIVPELPP